MASKNIPEEDLKTINDSFKHDREAETIKKNASGRIVTAKKDIVNPRGYKINSWYGRKLRHNKSVIPRGGRQYTVGKKGQKYEDIPETDRKKVSWRESDFE